MSDVAKVVTTLLITAVSLYFSASALRNLFALIGQVTALLLFLWLAKFVASELGSNSLFEVEMFYRAGHSAAHDLLWDNIDRLIAALQFAKTFQR